MDREAIERRDFPVGRRGYDQAAVDAHLRRVADELETLRDRPLPATAASSLSAGTSEQVRLILEAAETSAARLREEAGAHVARVEEATGGMLSRLDELERELGGLLDALRRSGERLTEGLAQLQAQVGETAPAPPEEDFAAAAPAAADPPRPAAAGNGDEAGARLIALNMALGGSPREETARYLAEHFTLADRDALLDDVYAQADR